MKSFPTFTTSRPRSVPGRKPAGVQQCSSDDLRRWELDRFRFPPYQYCMANCLVNKHNELRVPDVAERELMLGFPLNFTAGCLPKNRQKGDEYNDCRLTLLGNTWSVVVVASLLGQLLTRLGMLGLRTPQDHLNQTSPGGCPSVQGRLIGWPLIRGNRRRKTLHSCLPSAFATSSLLKEKISSSPPQRLNKQSSTASERRCQPCRGSGEWSLVGSGKEVGITSTAWNYVPY